MDNKDEWWEGESGKSELTAWQSDDDDWSIAKNLNFRQKIEVDIHMTNNFLKYKYNPHSFDGA